MRLYLLPALFITTGFAQEISYSPGMTLEKTVSLTYYDTDYLFIQNISEEPMTLGFELITDDLPQAWSATGCTHIICYVKVPDAGPLGTLLPGEEGYISINLSANETAGEGELAFAVFNENNPALRDTVRFHYTVSADSAQVPQPWAAIQYAANVLTVFLSQASTEASLKVFDLNGNLIHATDLEAIYTYSTQNLASGIYIVAVENEQGQRLQQKISVLQP